MLDIKLQSPGPSRETDPAKLLGWLKERALKAGRDPESIRRVVEYAIRAARDELESSSHPLQQAQWLFPSLTAKPWHDPSAFGFIADIERGYRAVQSEFRRIRELGRLRPTPGDFAERGEWSSYYFFSTGFRFDRNCAECPETVALLQSIQGVESCSRAYFSVAAPHTHIRPHCGPFNIRITVHLGLLVPEQTGIRVGSESRTWTEGKCIVFDDSFEHEVWNDSDEDRAVLLFDIWHPDLSDDEKWALNELRDVFTFEKEFTEALRTAHDGSQNAN